MASIVRHGDGWRAHIYVKGVRESALFTDRREAKDWAYRRELDLSWHSTFKPPRIRIMSLDELRDMPQVRETFPVSGVYFLWSRGELVYIGQSRNVAKRVAKHRVKPPAPFDFATYLSVPHPWQLAIEMLYIDSYLPHLAPIEKAATTIVPAPKHCKPTTEQT